MMLQRPKVGETEEDLLKQEAEFLKQSGKELNRKRNHESDGVERTVKVPGVIGDIVEKNQLVSGHNVHVVKGKGFPSLFQVDVSLSGGKKGRKSLFALHMEKNKRNDDVLNKEECKMEVEEEEKNQDDNKSVDMALIHEENMRKLSEMSKDEILEEQKRLYESLDPKLISLLKNRSKGKQTGVGSQKVVEKMECEVIEDDGEIKKTISGYVGEKWLNMDFIEKEKLEWVGDIPDSKSLDPDQPYSARFDFRGELQPFSADVDVTKALHHHGDEPERPGYTIQELYQLSRSTVLQQRILAINTIANIIRKTKLGYYDCCFDGFLLHKLMESDLFLLLRFSIDENALVPAAVNCLRRLLYNDSDEYCLDKLLGVDDDVQPFLFDKIDADEDEEKELKDNTIINCDVIKGVLRTDLLVRIGYVLNKLPCDRETVINAVYCLIRTARHSLKSSREIINQFLDFAYQTIKIPNPMYQSVKLFRILTGECEEFAVEISKKYQLGFLIDFVNAEDMPEIPKREFYFLKLEILYLWRNFIRFGRMLEEFRSWTPCLVRLLRFYIEKIDLCGEGDFDFELFVSFVSLIRSYIGNRLDVDSNIVSILRLCLEKWVRQLSQFGKFNFAGLKALGACFSFFVDYFNLHEIDTFELCFIDKMRPVIIKLINCEVFDVMCGNLVDYSHVLVSGLAKRDPPNLPSLNSVYESGCDYLKIVNNRSCLLFFVGFFKYLRGMYNVVHNTKEIIIGVAQCRNLRMYTTKILQLKYNTENWFNRYETALLTDLVQLYSIINDSDTIKLCFRLLPMIRTDDDNIKPILSIITDKKSWRSDNDCFDGLYQIYLDHIYTPKSVVLYKGEQTGDDWIYKILTTLKGKEAVAENAKILKFIAQTDENLLTRIPYTTRYYHSCAVFLTDANVFEDEIQTGLTQILKPIQSNRQMINLDIKISKNKSFYDLYTELITQYAAVSYGLHIFAKYILFPLQNKYNISFRKLLWFEYLHVLRVVTLPYPATDFVDIDDFVHPCETDESLLVAYLNSISKNVIIKDRNPFVYQIAVLNVRNYLNQTDNDPKLASFLRLRVENVKNERVRLDILS